MEEMRRPRDAAKDKEGQERNEVVPKSEDEVARGSDERENDQREDGCIDAISTERRRFLEEELEKCEEEDHGKKCLLPERENHPGRVPWPQNELRSDRHRECVKREESKEAECEGFPDAVEHALTV
jgi:hypothetical protein